MRNRLSLLAFAFIISLCLASSAAAQGLQSSPYSAPSLLRGDALSPVSSDMFRGPDSTTGRVSGFQDPPGTPRSERDIPNLQAGYIYYSGKNLRLGYLTLDYLLPIRLGENSIVFGEAHSEFRNFSRNASPRANDKVYLSMGGGYRTVLGRKAIVGFNGFYDAAQFSDQWLSSGGAGVEMAFLIHGFDALDINFNWYGDISDSDLVVNEFRDGPFNYELQAGYSHQLFDEGPDLRLYATGYKFDDKTGVYGWQAGAELKSPDGVVSIRGETAYDHVNDSYQTLSASVNLGFRIEDLFQGRNPFGMPERIFNSPRNFDRLTNKVKRHWRHTTHGVSLASTQTITVVNNRKKKITLYMGFKGSYGSYSPKDFSGFSVAPKSCNKNGLVMVMNKELGPGDHVVINFDPQKGQISPAFSVDRCTWNCTQATPQTLAEFTLQGGNSRDYADISLVNGFNYPMEITSTVTGSPPIKVIRVDSATGNKNKSGVYPLYCDECNKSALPGCTFPPDQSECSPDNLCQVNFPYGGNYTVSILSK